LGNVLDIAAGAAVTGGEPDKLYVLSFVPFKGTFTVFQCPQAFSPGTRSVPVADDYPDLEWFCHVILLSGSFLWMFCSYLRIFTMLLAGPPAAILKGINTNVWFNTLKNM
jgi:hypothetical protein